MPRTRRRKRILFAGMLLLFLLVTGYFFRYPLLLRFQYARLRSLDCGRNGLHSDCMGRIWVHRVNSTERYQLLKDNFNGFEADLCFQPQTNSFFIYHPPLTGQTPVLSLDKYLQQADLSQKKIWLDTRYVGPSNADAALSSLSKYGDTLTLKKACVFELYDPATAALFAQRGYTCSFNVDAGWLPRLQADEALRDSITNQLNAVKYISQDAAYLPALKELFPSKSIAVWELHMSSFFNGNKFRQLLNDQQVAILFVNIKTPYFR